MRKRVARAAICRPVVERVEGVGAAAPISRAVDTPVKVSRHDSARLVHEVNRLRFDGPSRRTARLWGWSFRPLGWSPMPPFGSGCLRRIGSRDAGKGKSTNLDPFAEGRPPQLSSRKRPPKFATCTLRLLFPAIPQNCQNFLGPTPSSANRGTQPGHYTNCCNNVTARRSLRLLLFPFPPFSFLAEF